LLAELGGRIRRRYTILTYYRSVKKKFATLEAIFKRTGGVGPPRYFLHPSQCVYPDVISIDPFANERIAAPSISLSPCRESGAKLQTSEVRPGEVVAEKIYDADARNHGFRSRLGCV